MISKTDMKSQALWAQAQGLQERAATIKLAELGMAAKQRDLNKLRAYLLAEAGKLRAKVLGIEDAEKKRKLQQLIGGADEDTTKAGVAGGD